MTHSRISKTDRVVLETEWQIFDRIVGADHPYRRLTEIIDFDQIVASLESCYSEIGTEGLPIEAGLKTLLVQFWEDYSDREMEKCLRENMAVRWFCGFGLTDETPDHSYFGKLRKRIGGLSPNASTAPNRPSSRQAHSRFLNDICISPRNHSCVSHESVSIWPRTGIRRQSQEVNHLSRVSHVAGEAVGMPRQNGVVLAV